MTIFNDHKSEHYHKPKYVFYTSLDSDGNVIIPTVQKDDDRVYLFSQPEKNSMTVEQLEKVQKIDF